MHGGKLKFSLAGPRLTTILSGIQLETPGEPNTYHTGT
jgi:hypothetical protein